MASTYSSNLKIELIATGEQTNTWGATTNTNLGTALEQAIVGYGNPIFAADADLTISLSNSNATQTARNFVLNVTSSTTLTSTWNLIVPTIQKPYIIQNNTTGGQSIVVKTVAGTGVTVPNGKKAFVYADGTNVVSAVDYLPTLTLGTALALSSGGTGATTASTARTALDVPSTSGSGATGTWNIAISGNAATATTATTATSATTATTATAASSLATANYSIVQESGLLYIKYGSTKIAYIDNNGNFKVIADVTAYGSM